MIFTRSHINKHMKQWICLILCIIVSVVLVACGRESAGNSAINEKSDGNTVTSDNGSMKKIYQYEKQKINISAGKQNIYGIAYIPQAEEKVPLVIFSHELGYTHTSGISYAESLASHGIAVYIFDFRGGSDYSQSDGKTTEMSVMTEADDIESVIQSAREWSFIDIDKIILIGASQGGMASAVAVSKNPEIIAGLVLLYPALLISDVVHEEFASLNDVPDQFFFNGWIYVGRNYVADVWDYDIYKEMSDYQKPVLILHGDRDSIVDISYSHKASESYPDAEFHTIHGAGHGFYGRTFNEAMDYILDYISRVIN